MGWINERYEGRLFASFRNGYVRFKDCKTGECVEFDVLEKKHCFAGISGIESQWLIGRYKAKYFRRGEGLTDRDVYHYVTRQHCTVLRAGLTVHRSAFSSTPHEFETNLEPGFEEVFYFMTDGKGLLEGEGLWPDGKAVNAAWPVRDQTFAQAPMGWHRVIALPNPDGSIPQMSYLWAYLCLKPEWEKD